MGVKGVSVRAYAPLFWFLTVMSKLATYWTTLIHGMFYLCTVSFSAEDEASKRVHAYFQLLTTSLVPMCSNHDHVLST